MQCLHNEGSLHAVHNVRVSRKAGLQHTPHPSHECLMCRELHKQSGSSQSRTYLALMSHRSKVRRSQHFWPGQVSAACHIHIVE